jgi:hypothetical protein
VILAADLDILDLSVLHDFLWVLDDFIARASNVCNNTKFHFKYLEWSALARNLLLAHEK